MAFARLRGVSLAATLALVMALPTGAPVAAATPARVVDAEAYALSLLNCTRTGGWVKRDGTCKNRGSGKHSAKRKPLPMHQGISRKVAWPFARALVQANICGHVIAGKPDLSGRMRGAGFRHHYFGENVGCGWGGGSPAQVVLETHLAMQAEKRVKGGHWRNIKNAKYRSVGIGVATRNGTTMVVWDFYGKRK